MDPTKPSELAFAPTCPYCGLIWGNVDMRRVEVGDSVIVECAECDNKSEFRRLRYKYTSHMLH